MLVCVVPDPQHYMSVGMKSKEYSMYKIIILCSNNFTLPLLLMSFYPYLHEKKVLTSNPSIDEQQPLNTGAHEKTLKTWLTNVFPATQDMHNIDHKGKKLYITKWRLRLIHRWTTAHNHSLNLSTHEKKYKP